MTALRDMLATAFAADIAAVTPEVCEVLHFEIRCEENRTRRDALRNALEILARPSADLSLAVIGGVRARFDAKLASRAASFARTSKLSMDDLSLLDDAALQVEIALDQCAARLREQASAELFQLSARMCEMLGVESIADCANPILPRIFAGALLDSIANLGLADAARLPVFKAYGPALLHIAPDLYRHANSLLGDLGVLPGFKARYGSPLQIGPAAQRSVPAMLDERVLTSLLERLLDGERAQVAPTGMAANVPVTTAAAVPSRFTGMRVMVVDDSNTIRRCAEIFLKQAGCEVILADNGFEALAKAAIDMPDLILLDILMPRLDGYQTCALLRKNAMHRATPIVMLSSKDTMFDRAKGRMAGSSEHLAKPFTKENLLNVLAAQLAPQSHRKPTSKAMEGVIRA